MKPIVVHLIAAARPNFMKVAPLYHELASRDWCEPLIVHTGQHYDKNMSDAFFTDLRLPKPHIHLGVGSGTHAQQTGGVMMAYEEVCLDDASRPDWIIVAGDVNSTVACAMVGAKLWIPTVHLEAGLRSGDRKMPEEINRLLTDSIADVLWTPSPDGDEHLIREGTDPAKITRIGNIMLDSYDLMRDQIEADKTRVDFGFDKKGYGVVTLHRPSNVDTVGPLTTLVDQIELAAAKVPLVFAVHPRTRARLDEFGLSERLDSINGLTLCGPLGYIQFMSLVSSAKLVITDSGGIQEETTYLNIPCLTLRTSTERPITIDEGTNELVVVEDLMASVQRVLDNKWPSGRRPERWDGKTAARAADDLLARHKAMSDD
ncbi:MAG: non-hydrolyzing UDP-N-acetylglucosamine 2-epimerase [Gammaproteobacteria bacterium]